MTNDSGLREKIARAIRFTVQSNTYRDERGHTHMGLGLNGVDEATDQIMALISPAGEVGRADALLREVFAGKVQVAFAGNPNVCDRLEARVLDYFARSALKGRDGADG